MIKVKKGDIILYDFKSPNGIERYIWLITDISKERYYMLFLFTKYQGDLGKTEDVSRHVLDRLIHDNTYKIIA